MLEANSASSSLLLADSDSDIDDSSEGERGMSLSGEVEEEGPLLLRLSLSDDTRGWRR